MPTWKNLFVVQLILFPIQVVTWLFQMIAGKKLSDEERIQLYCDKMGITREEYDKKVQQILEKQEKIKNSSKYKRANRYMKKVLYEQGALKPTASGHVCTEGNHTAQ